MNDKNLELINKIMNSKTETTDEPEKIELGCRKECMNNVVSEDKLKEVQQSILNYLKECLSKTYGPMGSYTAIISGNNAETIQADYSKDGLKVLKHIIFDSPIEMSLQSELRDICQYVEKQVGDGTTSAVILSSLVYDGMLKIIKDSKIPPRKLVKEFQSVVKECQDIILGNGREITLEDIHKICMISTNGNVSVADQITDVYKEYGFNVNIDVGISNDQDTKLKIYDGLTINSGYSDPAYINNMVNGTADIHNPEIFAFQDPIDTPEMITYFEKILVDNIFDKIQNDEPEVPTVIIAPMLSRDGSGLLTKLIGHLYNFSKNGMNNQKPQILILTNIHGTEEYIASDIEKLCGCKYIRKYISADVQKHDQENGDAPTLETIHEFAGSAELVVADNAKTKFINPKSIVDKDGNYEIMINFLKSEISKAKAENEDQVTVGRLKKRLNCLEANLIEFLVGGISISDRDSLRDLVEDAVLNCASAVENGVGRAANFEGLSASYSLFSDYYKDGKEPNPNDIRYNIITAIFGAYYKAAEILYGSVIPEDKIADIIEKSIENNMPFNVMDLFDADELDNIIPEGTVLCSIRTDVVIMDAISKIITMMVTANQCLLQAPSLNRY